MPLRDLLWECFRPFVHLDESNAAVHTAKVRYSPITFRLAEELADGTDALWAGEAAMLTAVLTDKGAYEEDPGR